MGFNLLSIKDTSKSNAFITPWSFIHLLSGGLIYLYLKYIYVNISIVKSFIIMIILHTLYEINDLRYHFKKKKERNYWDDNSLINSLGDTICAIIGFLIAIQIKKVNVHGLVCFTFVYLILIHYFKKKKIG